MPQAMYTQAEVDQLLAKTAADTLAAATANDITVLQVQAAAAAAAKQAVAGLPAPTAGVTLDQVQKLIDASIAKALVSMPRTYVGTAFPPDAPDQSILLVPTP